MADDVTQAVFIVLAQRAKTIKRESALPGWLFKTTRYAAANAIRMEQRRRKHERAAATQRPEAVLPNSSTQANSLIPLLNQAIANLSEGDRDAILLRYLKGYDIATVSAKLATSEAAARRRVERAVGRLRKEFIRRGVTAGAPAIAVALTAASAQTAPAGVANAAVAAASGAVPSATALTIVQGVHSMILWAQAKFIATIAIAAVVLTAIPATLLISAEKPGAAESQPLQQISALPATQPDSKAPLDVICAGSDGKPIGGAEVYLAQAIYRGSGERDVVQTLRGPTLADAAGHARFADLPTAGPGDTGVMQTVYARVPGKFMGTASLQWSGAHPRKLATSMTIALVPSVTVHGRLVLPDKYRLKSAKIQTSTIMLHGELDMIGPALWLRSGPCENFLANIYDPPANADGTFTLADLPSDGSVYLIANASGLAETQMFLGLPATASAPMLHMRPQAIIRGRLTKPDGTPAAQVAIKAQPIGVSELIVENHTFDTITDADGRYTIDRLPGIYVGLLASTPDLVMPVQPIRLNFGDTITKDVILQPGTLVQGMATDTQGKPLADVSVGVSEGLDILLARATTDAAGRYSVRVLPGKVTIYIAGPPDGFDYPKKSDNEKTITVPSATAIFQGPTWRLPKPKPALPFATATLEGRVVDANGQGIANLSLTDSRVEDWGSEMMPVSDPGAAKTDADGHYSFKVQARIKHTLSPSSLDFDHPETETVTPGPDQTIAFDDLVVHPRPVVGSISGIVIDPQDHPLEGVAADFYDPSIPTSDAQGRFTVPVRSTTQPAMLMLTKAGYKYRNWNDIPPGTHDLRLTLYPSPDSGPDYNARTKLPSPKSLVNTPAPALHIDWVFTPTGNTPDPIHSNGKLTVIAFNYDEDQGAAKFVAELAKDCTAGDAVPIVVYSPQSTAAGVRALFAGGPPSANIGIDQYWPDANPNDPNGITQAAYRAVNIPIIYVISRDGTIIYTQHGLAGLAAHLAH